jgi:tRNA threonylcarbamoyladenosine biosynthesis protein TsaB
MKILALDTSTGWLSVALYDGQRAVALREHVGNAASERILPAIGEVLAREDASLASLTGIAYGAGPGSFTGVRIACSVAQGLGFGAARPLFAVCTLEAIAQASWRTHGWRRVVACLDARMREVYVAAYERDGNGWRCVREPMVCKPDAVEAMSFPGWQGAGDGFAAFPALASRLGIDPCDAAIIPDAESIAQCAWPSVAAGTGGVAAEHAQPIYVRHRIALTSVERAAGQRL